MPDQESVRSGRILGSNQLATRQNFSDGSVFRYAALQFSLAIMSS